MFARVFNTAKRILSRSPSVQGIAEESVEATRRSLEADIETDMVTTRQGTSVDMPGMSTPRSSAKRGRGKRELEAGETPTAAKRRRKSVNTKQPPQEESTEAPESAVETQREEGRKDEADGVFDTVVAMPDRTREKSPADKDKLPSCRRGSPRVVIPKMPSPHTSAGASPTRDVREEDPVPTQRIILHTSAAQKSSSVYTTPAAQTKREGPPMPKTSTKVKPSTPASTRKSPRRHERVEQVSELTDAATLLSGSPDDIPSTLESDQVTMAIEDSVPTSTPSAEKLHKRFSSEEPVYIAGPTTKNLQSHAHYDALEASKEREVHIDEVPLDDDASDSDEAPEIVTTATAALKARATAEETSRAHLAQQEKEERRKQQRTDRIAEEQLEKRKRDEKRAKRLAKLQAREGRAKRQDSTPPRAPLDVDMNNLPALLPDSILRAVADRHPPTPPLVRTGKTAEQLRKDKLNRHIKFLERGEKPIKDLKKGSVNVSVLAQQNALLAPKVNRNTKNIREHWLKGRQQDKRGKKGVPQGQSKKMERRAVRGGGFLRGGDD